ncbi:MAG: hypothetical protein JWR26_1231 [Pedosphaera sp.]|nr:hypothetical protein [Pedosphaera sp.]
MWSNHRNFVLAFSTALMLAALTSQGHAQSATQNKTAAIQGEPISPATSPKTPPPDTGKITLPAPPKGSNTTAAASIPAAAAGKAAKETPEVDFEELASFEFETPSSLSTNLSVGVAEANKQFPPGIMKWDGKVVSITGFPLTLAVEKGKVTELLVMKNQGMCCFGTAPKLTEWVTVKLAGEGVESVPMDQLVTVKGTLHVGARTESHTILDLYRMDGAKMTDY